jgi:hypothetical protein
LYRCIRKKADTDSSQGGTILSKKMKPANQIGRTPFGDLTNIQLSGIIYCLLSLLNKDSDEYPLSCWIVLCLLDDITDNSKIYEEPSGGVIQTPSDYQGLHDKTCQQTRLRVQHCHQNKDFSSIVRKGQSLFTDVSTAQQSGII